MFMRIIALAGVLTTCLVLDVQASERDALIARLLENPNQFATVENEFVSRILGREAVEGNISLVVESVPRSPISAAKFGYGRIQTWVDLSIMKMRKTRNWDEQGNLAMTIYFRDFKRYEERLTAHEVEVIDHLSGHTSRLKLNDDGWSVYENVHNNTTHNEFDNLVL